PSSMRRPECCSLASTGWPRLAGMRIVRRFRSGEASLNDSATSLESVPRTQPRLALADLVATVALRRLWLRLGWNDILYRYRRSILGPLWFTLSTAIMAVVLGVVYSELFQTRLSEFMPYVSVSLV